MSNPETLLLLFFLKFRPLLEKTFFEYKDYIVIKDSLKAETILAKNSFGVYSTYCVSYSVCKLSH